ncbi:MAG: ABC transporter permease [Desulfovibrio sp.]|nr:MAG: ABC transporter permease [Desulfovibrio sp.]
MKAGIVLYAMVCAALLGCVAWGLTRDPVAMTLSQTLASPSWDLPFGADHLGRDILARVAHGFYWDFSLSLAVVGCCAVLGVCLGLASGWIGGWIDGLLNLVMDSVLSLPHIVLAMVIMVALSYGPESLVIALVLPGWIKYARIIRAQTLSLKQADFVACERVLGANAPYILFRHILPNAVPPVLGLAALDLGHTLLSIASLGFLGLGLQPPSPEWGTMIMESRPYIMRAPWNAFFPGLFVFLFIFLFTLAGRKAEAALSPSTEDAHVAD